MKSLVMCCKTLSVSFSSETVASVMATKVVESSGGFLCLPCNKFVYSESSIRRHVREEHINPNISFVCPICKNRYKNKSTFYVHIYKNHPELKGTDYNRFAVQDM